MSRHIVITGAAGFLGREVLKAALEDQTFERVIACDIVPIQMTHPKLTVLTCALDAADVLRAIGGADVVIHLAAILGGAAEKDPRGARAVNLDATFTLIEACRPQTRFVFASSLAVLGKTTSGRAPSMVYGSHKAMVEIALETATRRGEVDGISLRPGGIVARAADGAGLKSSFLSEMFLAMRNGQDITLPVSESGETLLSSVGNVAANFLHAATTADLGDCRSLTLPMTKVRFADLEKALRNAFPDSPSKLTYVPDPEMMYLFGQARPIEVQNSIAAGFEPDPDLAHLIENALDHGDQS